MNHEVRVLTEQEIENNRSSAYEYINFKKHYHQNRLVMEIKIGDAIWHPCSIDIIEHRVIGITQYETFTHYHLRAVHNVGACGKIEVIVNFNKGKLRFVELVDEEHIEYAAGLQDFVEGFYYTNKADARLEFYNKQETLCWSSMEKHKRLYEESKKNYERVKAIIKQIKDEKSK